MSTEKWVLAWCKISKEAAVVRERCWLASCHHPAESTSLLWDEWLWEHKFCKAGAGLSSRCGLTKEKLRDNLIAHWPRHNLINLHNFQKTNAAKMLLPTLQAKLSQTRHSGVEGSMGGSRWGEVGLLSAAASRLIQGVKLARLRGNSLLAMFVWRARQQPGISSL